MSTSALHDSFTLSAERSPNRVALIEPGRGQITYAALDALAGRVRDRLGALGVRPGDRVGIVMRKSIDTVASILGTLRAGGTYVPVDSAAPPSRGAYILQNCAVKAVVVERRHEAALREELAKHGEVPALIVVEEVGGGKGIERTLDELDSTKRCAPIPTHSNALADLAYILYTSGSTGLPKGVMLSHENATSFVDWCSDTFSPTSEDRFSSHAPFHFDLSILDIYVPLKHGASLVLISEDAGKDPAGLARVIADYGITCWYSAPSILSLLAQHGDLEQRDCSKLRLVLFAGEVFPVKHLRRLSKVLPHPRYFNLYGPTETNVCTFYELTLPIPDDRVTPMPIGKVCSHLKGRVVDESGRDVLPGGEGELCIAGRGVMQGYWDLPQQTLKGFIDGGADRWYRTGDIVTQDSAGDFVYIGRRDRMVKRRGYRVELGEIEAGLYAHPSVKEAAVVAQPDEDAGVKIRAFLSCREERKPSMIEMKRHCSTRLPLYMIPDQFVWCDALPKTSTDKIDYQRLKEMA